MRPGASNRVSVGTLTAQWHPFRKGFDSGMPLQVGVHGVGPRES